MSNSISTQKSTRLDLIDHDLDSLLKTYDLKKAKSAIRALAAYIKNQVKIDNPVIQICADYLSKGEIISKELMNELKISAEKLDDEYLTVSDNFEAGLTNKEKVINSFSTARAANALLCATETDAHTALAEMIYETHASLQNLDELKRLVLLAK